MVQEIYGAKLRETDIFAIDRGDGKGQERWETLSKRVTEHVYSLTYGINGRMFVLLRNISLGFVWIVSVPSLTFLNRFIRPLSVIDR